MEVLMILLFLACLAVLYFKPQKEGSILLFWCATGLCFFMYMVGSINAILPNMTY